MAMMGRTLSAMVLTGTVTALAGCETIGSPLDLLSGNRTSPDEFQVLARKPLRMPGSLALPEPRLGEISPLEPDPNTDAVIALLGAPVQTASTGATSGEQALLGAANAAASQTEIRGVLQDDIDNPRSDEPYETPSLLDLISGDDDAPPEDALDASVESRRLQTEGVSAAPINPNDDPNGPPPLATSDGADLFYRTDDGRPSNTLPSQETTPAF